MKRCIYEETWCDCVFPTYHSQQACPVYRASRYLKEQVTMASELTVKIVGKGANRKIQIEAPLDKKKEYVSSTGKMINLVYGLSAWDEVVDGNAIKIQLNVGRKNPDYVKEDTD